MRHCPQTDCHGEIFTNDGAAARCASAMTATTRSTLYLAIIYIALTMAFGWWMEKQFRSATRGVMADTAALIGREVSDALHDVSIDQLIGGDHAARARLRAAIGYTARQSAVLSGLSVVDREGRVVASENSQLQGQHLAKPKDVFAQDQKPHLISSFAGPFDLGTYLLLTPVFNNNALVGYIQMNVNNRSMGRFYEGIYWRLLLFALVGLAAILTISILLHLRLSRLQQRLADMFDVALSGREANATVDKELAPIQSVANRLGRELTAARAGAEFARRERDAVAKVFQFGVLLWSPEGELEFANEAARQILTGGQPEQLAEQVQQMREALVATAAQVSGGVSPVQRDIELTIDGTVRRFRLEMYAMDQPESRRYLAVIKDRDMITALENDLRTATRFYGLAILYVGAAHDLRGPLNNMVVYLELLKQSARRAAQREPESEESISQRKYIEMIQQSIYSLNSYVQALLDLTAPAKDVTDETDVGQALTEIAGLLRAPAKLQGVALDWHLPDKPLRVIGQPVQLRQALLNVIINALEAMPIGGALTVRGASTDAGIDIEICDKGAGIPEVLQERIFDMHFTTKAGRTGIGLYVARSIIQEHGGTLEVHSKLGAGSCFQVHLPVGAVAAQAENY